MNNLVIDHGSYSCKYGKIGFSKPDGSIKVINNEIINGCIQDYDTMIPIWTKIFNKYDKPNEVLLTISTTINEHDVSKMYEIMFETFNANYVQVANQQILSLYTSGRNKGLVVDIGHDLTRLVPVYDSYIIESGINYYKVAGKYLNSLINMDSLWCHKLKKSKSTIKNIDLAQVFIKSEIEDKSLPQVIKNSIENVDIDLRKTLTENIVLVGGTTAMPNLTKTLFRNTKYFLPDCKMKALKDRSYASWVGGSILSCLPTFKNSWISHKHLK